MTTFFPDVLPTAARVSLLRHDAAIRVQHKYSRERREQQQTGREAEGCAGKLHRTVLRIEDPPNAVDQVILGHARRLRDRRGGGAGQQEQRAGVVERPPGVLHDDLVAAVLALPADPAGQHPNGRVEEQGRFHNPLEQVHQVVPPPHVGQFMQQRELDLFRAPACH